LFFEMYKTEKKSNLRRNFSGKTAEPLLRVCSSRLIDTREAAISDSTTAEIIRASFDFVEDESTHLNVLQVEERHVGARARKSRLLRLIVTHSTTSTKKNERSKATHEGIGLISNR